MSAACGGTMVPPDELDEAMSSAVRLLVDARGAGTIPLDMGGDGGRHPRSLEEGR